VIRVVPFSSHFLVSVLEDTIPKDLLRLSSLPPSGLGGTASSFHKQRPPGIEHGLFLYSSAWATRSGRRSCCPRRDEMNTSISLLRFYEGRRVAGLVWTPCMSDEKYFGKPFFLRKRWACHGRPRHESLRAFFSSPDWCHGAYKPCSLLPSHLLFRRFEA